MKITTTLFVLFLGAISTSIHAQLGSHIKAESIIFPKSLTAPSFPEVGEVYYKQGSNRLTYYNGSSWNNLGPYNAIVHNTDPTTSLSIFTSGTSKRFDFVIESKLLAEFYLNPNNQPVFEFGTGGNNISFGTEAGILMDSGTNNTQIGSKAGKSLISGSGNSLYGARAGELLGTSMNNTFMGYLAGGASTGGNNTFIGREAGRNNVGGNNVILGYQTGMNSNSGNDNTYLGAEAGKGTLGSGNVFIGRNAGATTPPLQIN